MKSLEEIRKDVVWEHGYYSWEDFVESIYTGLRINKWEFTEIIQECQVAYAREVERYYNEDLSCPHCYCNVILEKIV